MNRKVNRLDAMLSRAFASPNAPPGDETGLDMFRRVARAMAVPTFEAPDDVVSKASAIAPRTEPIRARIMGGTPWAIGARRTGIEETFQIAFELDDLRIRVLYAKIEEGWEMLGRTSLSSVEVWCGDKRLDVASDGSFRIVVRQLEETALTIRGEIGEIVVPSATEALNHGPDRSD